MTCYNCGYSVSVVSKDDIGWQCEWCSDHELRSPTIKFLKKRIDELSNIEPLPDPMGTYNINDVNQLILQELEKILGDKNESN